LLEEVAGVAFVAVSVAVAACAGVRGFLSFITSHIAARPALLIAFVIGRNLLPFFTVFICSFYCALLALVRLATGQPPIIVEVVPVAFFRRS
jgi:hypothetical protein